MEPFAVSTKNGIDPTGFPNTANVAQAAFSELAYAVLANAVVKTAFN